jgi:hypothetical protein
MAPLLPAAKNGWDMHHYGLACRNLLAAAEDAHAPRILCCCEAQCEPCTSARLQQSRTVCHQLWSARDFVVLQSLNTKQSRLNHYSFEYITSGRRGKKKKNVGNKIPHSPQTQTIEDRRPGIEDTYQEQNFFIKKSKKNKNEKNSKEDSEKDRIGWTALETGGRQDSGERLKESAGFHERVPWSHSGIRKKVLKK